MSFVCDAHVHLYQLFNFEEALLGGYRRLQELFSENSNHVSRPDTTLMLLTERNDCDYFSLISKGKLPLPPTCRLRDSSESGVLRIEVDSAKELLLIAGRQIVTAERLEILALLTEEDIPDRLATTTVLNRIRSSGGVPVLNWAPGKWMFKRKPLVANLIQDAQPGELLIGDSSLRPSVWTEPRLMQLAESRKLGIIAGSDPLPLTGEEKLIGSYGLISKDISLRTGKEAADLRALLLSEAPPLQRVGYRRGPVQTALAIATHMRKKHKET